jgi:hypothetical protein
MVARWIFLGFVLFLVDWIFFDGSLIVLRAYDVLKLIAGYLADILMPFFS